MKNSLNGYGASKGAKSKFTSSRFPKPRAPFNSNLIYKGESHEPRVLHLGNLSQSVTEEQIKTLFEKHGKVVRVKIFSHAESGFPYAFVEFSEHQAANEALQKLNKQVMAERPLKIEWSYYQMADSSNDFSDVYVGGLAEVRENELRDEFKVFGEIKAVKFIHEFGTHKFRGFCFITFARYADAQQAIMKMNGKHVWGNQIQVRWGDRQKPNTASAGRASTSCMSYEEILGQSSTANTSVYIRHLSPLVEEKDLHTVFGSFGQIVDVRHFKPQGYAFIKYASHESAARAIFGMNDNLFMGSKIICRWGNSQQTQVQNAVGQAQAINWPYAPPQQAYFPMYPQQLYENGMFFQSMQPQCPYYYLDQANAAQFGQSYPYVIMQSPSMMNQQGL